MPRLPSFTKQLASLRVPGSVSLATEVRTGVAHLTLRNAERRNALSGPMMVQLDEAVRSLESWHEGRVLLLSGEGGHFCSGADLGTVRQAIDTPERGALMSRFMTEVLDRLRNLPLLTVAAIDGAAVGGGAELCTAADIRVVSSNARIKFVHTRLGAAPGWGGAARLVQEVGRATALRLLLHSETIDAENAVSIGLAHAAGVEGESAVDVAIRTIVGPSLEASASVESMRAIKRQVAESSKLPSDVLREQTRLFTPLWGAGANRDAVHAQTKPAS
mmetsp:Transcript_22411/g.68284  ORF Transcript_22411/g.68284 Transcript_22411/m.68284 type:complete len:275 (+) Transcript_22411:160-984(+)